ncbi:hypothetical protein P5673_014098 [Acropora cervicornis]|uniref:Integrase catalytic domain-containing protein n=1 Tax=Acropora cervicornis TaxID=6130 RepID=A0AAD9V632_ACRCE|nr:hypothetical protein P5673_014098 [Acropora cervicornis]
MEKKLGEQIMAPAWDSTALDFFGPFKVKDEVKKRTTGKAYGLIFSLVSQQELFTWIFSSADAPWQNGISEALIKSVKTAITLAIGESLMTFSEVQIVCFEAANVINERPIGRHPTSPDDKSYLCPNDLLLGRSTSQHTITVNQGNQLICIMQEDTLQSNDQLTDWYCFYQWKKRSTNLTEHMI